MKALYADVILPLAFGSGLSYSVPEALAKKIRPGCRVRVPLGQKKMYTGIVSRLYGQAPAGISLKEIAVLIDEEPIVNAYQLEFWQWLSSYYLCTPGEVLKAALPAGLKVPGASKIRTRSFICLQPLLRNNSQAIEQSLAALSRAKKQQEALRIFLRLSSAENIADIPTQSSAGDFGQSPLKASVEPAVQARGQSLAQVSDQSHVQSDNYGPGLFKDRLIEAGLSAAVLKALIQKNILEVREVEIKSENLPVEAMGTVKQLSEEQQKALEAIRQGWESGTNVCLLHGVTSSGKTEIYIQLILENLRQGKQVLYLLPEIALSTQLSTRLKAVFGNRLGVYHSACSDAERTHLWNKQLGHESFDVILGVRSSVFLPFKSLGLVIVDEEHENSYKQQDPAPRYNARNAAIVLASLHGARTVLGTATPSIESYYNCRKGKYKLVELSSRYMDWQLPDVMAVNTAELKRKKRMKSLLSPPLIEKMCETLEAGHQIMLFRNRRAYAPMLECSACGWVPRCKRCDVSLAFHKQGSVLRCHYCGREYGRPRVCPSCGNTDFELRGYGTEKVEEEVRALFPAIRIARMDSDTMRNRNAYEKLICDFEQHRIDVLIGTQMLTKGLDFDRLQLVGILNADSMLNYPDFRAHEHAFQLMTQVSGRAGRKTGRGSVVIQTTDPRHSVIQNVLKNDYKAFFQKECEERSEFGYPPFSRLIEVMFRHRDETLLGQASSFFAALMPKDIEASVFGPLPPLVSRVKGLCIQKIILKIGPEISLKASKDYLCRARDRFMKDKVYRQVQLYFDVDPV